MYIINNDVGEKWSINLQDEATTNMIGIRELHEILLFYCIMIFTIVMYMSIYAIFSKKRWADIRHNTIIELIWTLTPAIILILIGIPSIQLLYNNEEIYRPDMTVKVKGLQWYWNYTIMDDINNYNFDSYPKEESDLLPGEYRLLEVDNRLILPVHTDIRFLVTGGDVIHSWAIPSLGIKIDAIPGRLNQSIIFILKEGVYYGQCSELCGAGHPFMPIVLEVVPKYKYILWLLSNTSLLPSTWTKNLISIKEILN